jgi:hypothetical protein
MHALQHIYCTHGCSLQLVARNERSDEGIRRLS